MTTLHRTAAIVLLSLLSLGARAQVGLFFGDYTPLTNTRYGSQAGTPELVSTGGEAMLVWTARNTVRVTRLNDGEKRAGQVAMESFEHDPAAVWTGSHLLV